MAMIDYGAVVFKNGKKMNHEMFTDMEEMVGWVDHPKKRYEDCVLVDKWGWSDCDKCELAQFEIRHTDTFGDYRNTTGDCRGKPIYQGGMEGNYYAFAGDRDLTFGFYKCRFVAASEEDGVIDEFWGRYDLSNMSFRLSYKGVPVHVKYLGHNVYHFSMMYKGDSYHVVYGYGIDAEEKIWNKVKVEYLGKRIANKVDRLYESIRRTAK